MNDIPETNREDRATAEKILKIKSDLGQKLLILTHHYQRKEIVDLGDYKGDSLGLSRRASEDEHARHIVFCGVHFMAESAAILAKSHQTVQIPAVEAGCWMADMVDAYTAERAWRDITAIAGQDSLAYPERQRQIPRCKNRGSPGMHRGSGCIGGCRGFHKFYCGLCSKSFFKRNHIYWYRNQSGPAIGPGKPG
jgi:hypothetical protein